MRKWLSAVTSLAVASVLMFSCGGGGGGGESSSAPGNAGGVVADEFLKGLLVKVKGVDCEKQPQLCAVTDKYGRFQIPGAAGKVLEVYYTHTGNCTVNLKLGEFKATKDKQVVTPLTLQQNEDAGGLVGLVLEAMADYGANSTDIIWDLSSINDTACEEMVSDLCLAFKDALNATCSNATENATVVSSIDFASLNETQIETIAAYFGGMDDLEEKKHHCKHVTPSIVKVVNSGFVDLLSKTVTLKGTLETDSKKDYQIKLIPDERILNAFKEDPFIAAGRFEDTEGKGIYVVGYIGGREIVFDTYILGLVYLDADIPDSVDDLRDFIFDHETAFRSVFISGANSKGLVGSGFWISEIFAKSADLKKLMRNPVYSLFRLENQLSEEPLGSSLAKNPIQTFRLEVSVDGSAIPYTKASIDDLRNTLAFLQYIDYRPMFDFFGNDYGLLNTWWSGVPVNEDQTIITDYRLDLVNFALDSEIRADNEDKQGSAVISENGLAINVPASFVISSGGDYFIVTATVESTGSVTENFKPDMVYYFTCESDIGDICSAGDKVPYLISGSENAVFNFDNSTIQSVNFRSYGFLGFPFFGD